MKSSEGNEQIRCVFVLDQGNLESSLSPSAMVTSRMMLCSERDKMASARLVAMPVLSTAKMNS